MKAIRTALILLAAGALIVPAASARPHDFEGIWVGTAELPERTFDDIVLVVEGAGTGVSGTISDGLEIIRPETAVSGMCPGGNTLVVAFSTADGLTLALTLKVRGDRLTGYWTDPDGQSGKIDLVRRFAPVEAKLPWEQPPISGNPR